MDDIQHPPNLWLSLGPHYQGLEGAEGQTLFGFGEEVCCHQIGPKICNRDDLLAQDAFEPEKVFPGCVETSLPWGAHSSPWRS